MNSLYKINFKYQNLMLRALVLLPLVIILPLLEFLLVQWLAIQISNIIFYVASILIMFAVVFLLFRFTGSLFVKSGKFDIVNNCIVIEMGKKSFTISIDDIKKADCSQSGIYGVKFATLVIEYIQDDKEKHLQIMSVDLKKKALKDTDVWAVFEMVKSVI